MSAFLSIVCNPTGQQNDKLTELGYKDFLNFSVAESQLTGYDPCLFCVGVTSSGMTEESYSRAIYDMTIAVALTLARLNPTMIKGKTENALLRLPFKAAYMFRPGMIQPLHGMQSRTTGYRILYTPTKPLLPLLRWFFPQLVTTTKILGRAMIQVAEHGYSKAILESRDINQVPL